MVYNTESERYDAEHLVSPQTTFDLTFLSLVHPGFRYRVDRIAGGLVNETARVNPIAETYNLASPAPRPFIAKHAPSVLRYPGPPIAFNRYRLEIESRALLLLDPDEPSSAKNLLDKRRLTILQQHENIAVPRCLHYSREAHILLQSDLGDLAPFAHWLCHSPTPPSNDEIGLTANSLGRFLGSLHQATSSLPEHQLHTMREHFKNPDAERVLYERTVLPVRDSLRVAFEGSETDQNISPNTDAICDGLERWWRDFDSNEASEPPLGAVFTHGDMWHANVFIMPPDRCNLQEQRKAWPRMAVIDWEFASMGRVGLDLARFSAYLFLFTQSKMLSEESKRRVRAFGSTLVSSFAGAYPDIKSQLARRSFAILYGLHMCNGASWHPGCKCEASRSNPCSHTKSIVRNAANWMAYGVDDSNTRSLPTTSDDMVLQHVIFGSPVGSAKL